MAFLLVGVDETDVPGFGGTSLYVAPPFSILALFLGGTPDAPGEGELEFALDSVLDSVAGWRLFHQLVVLDDGGTQGTIVASGGLELIYGR